MKLNKYVVTIFSTLLMFLGPVLIFFSFSGNGVIPEDYSMSVFGITAVCMAVITLVSLISYFVIVIKRIKSGIKKDYLLAVAFWGVLLIIPVFAYAIDDGFGDTIFWIVLICASILVSLIHYLIGIIKRDFDYIILFLLQLNFGLFLIGIMLGMVFAAGAAG